MAFERADYVTIREGSLSLFDFLYNRFCYCRRRDFLFTLKGVAHHLDCDIYFLTNPVKRLKELGYVTPYRMRSTASIWKTNFEDKSKEEMLSEVVSI